MGRYVLIEKELTSVNGATFQIICNAFLVHEYPGDLQSLGTTSGKQKTRKGRPDAFIIQEDGTYILAECTTRDKSNNYKTFVKKLEADLNACLDFEKLGIKASRVKTIILCYNSKLDTADTEALQQISGKYNIKLRFAGIDTLTLYLFTNGRIYANQYLNVPFDTGQILSKKEFLKLYGKKNLATPLDNELIDRRHERSALVEAIEKSNIVIVSGAAGVGKSRLCLASIDDFLAKYPAYSAYYITYKTGGIVEELSVILDSGKNYLFFVDDANRQLKNLLSVIYSSLDKDHICVKIVVTVRPYAKNEIVEVSQFLQPTPFHLAKLPDKTIEAIISGKDFNIKKPFKTKIIEISNGNPRIAIMAARAIQKNPSIGILKDVSSIYDEYFQGIINDKHIFASISMQKAIGLISFFYSLDLQYDGVRNVLEDFQMPYEKFVEDVFALEALELVEIYNRNVVKISEQVLSAYFFYKVFIKDQLLSFDILLSGHCDKYYSRLKDIIGPAYTSFGGKQPFNNIQGTLINHWRVIQDDFERAVNFLQIFGVSLPDKAFLFVKRECDSISVAGESEHSLWRQHSNPESIDAHPVIKVLIPFFRNGNDQESITAVALGIEYVKRVPIAFNALFYQLRAKFKLSYSDISDGFVRQKELYKLLKGTSGDEITNERLFFTLLADILLCKLDKKYYYKRENNGWQLPESIKELRGRFWNDLIRLFSQYTEACRTVLEEYVAQLPRTSNALLRFDEGFMYNIMMENLDPRSFKDCYLVHRYLTIIEYYHSLSPLLEKLKLFFFNESAAVFHALDADSPFRNDSQGWELNKEKIERLTIGDMEEFKKVYSLLLESQPFWKEKNKMKYTLGFWLSAIFKKDPQLGINSLQFIIADNNKLGIYPYNFFSAVFKLPAIYHEQIFTLIKTNPFNNSDEWMQNYFSDLKKDYATERLMHEALAFYKTSRDLSSISPYILNKFLQFDKNIHEKFFLLLFDRIERGDHFSFSLQGSVFTENKTLVKKHFPLSKRLYFHLKETQYQFDQFSEAFFALYEADNNFLLDYISYLQSRNNSDYKLEIRLLSKIWDYPDASTVVERLLLELKDQQDPNHIIDLSFMFFYHLDDEQKEKVFAFLKRMIYTYKEDWQVLNTVFDIAKACSKEVFLPLVKCFLAINDDFNVFSRIDWETCREDCPDYTTWLELIAGQLHEVYKTIDELPRHIQYIEHRNYLAEKIHLLQEDIAKHRKYDFMENWSLLNSQKLMYFE